MNWGQLAGWAGCGLSLLTAVGYALGKDWRRALYFFFAFCISLTVIWK